MLSTEELYTVFKIGFLYETYEKATINHADKKIIDDKGRTIAYFLRKADNNGYDIIPNFEVGDDFNNQISTAYRGFYVIKGEIERIIGREVGC
jgi:hypothetical protein